MVTINSQGLPAPKCSFTEMSTVFVWSLTPLFEKFKFMLLAYTIYNMIPKTIESYL